MSHGVHSRLAEPHDPEDPRDDRGAEAEEPARHVVPARELRMSGKTIDLRPVGQEEEGVQAAEHVFLAVDVRTRLPLAVEVVDPTVGPATEIGDRSELDRRGWARLGTRGHHAAL